MMRSLYSGVSGLKTHQTKMDVIGNNIANVNTTAYKASTVTFSDLMSQTTQSASGPNAATGTGGVNARQIGLGVKSGAINMNIATQGSAQSTGNPFDIMITGDAFFIVSNGTENFFTRDGSFYVDGAGNLAMTSTGYNVMGWKIDKNTGELVDDSVAALQIMHADNMTYDPEATTQAYVAGIVDKNDTDVTSTNGKVMNLSFFDKAGYSYTAKLVFRQSDDVNSYSVELDKILDSTGKEVDITDAQFGNPDTLQLKKTTVAFDSVNYKWDGRVLKDASDNVIVDTAAIFDADGNVVDQEGLDKLAKIYGYEGSTDEFLKIANATGTVDADGNAIYKSVKQMLMDGDFPTDASWEAEGRYYTGSTINFNPANGAFNGIGGNPTVGTMTLSLAGVGGGNFSDIVIDFSSCSMVDNKGTSTVAATSGDKEGVGAGRRIGNMIGVSIQNNGMIYASYDNGMTRLLGQIAVAEFANASGLEKAGDNLYSATLNSGEFNGQGVDITGNGGYMSTGQLEMSNVDLSSEFTEMITTQRGFQANSRIITVSDTMLEELTNLKR